MANPFFEFLRVTLKHSNIPSQALFHYKGTEPDTDSWQVRSYHCRVRYLLPQLKWGKFPDFSEFRFDFFLCELDFAKFANFSECRFDFFLGELDFSKFTDFSKFRFHFFRSQLDFAKFANVCQRLPTSLPT